MQLTKFPVVLVLLTARVLQAKIVLETSRPNKTTSDLIEGLVNIVTSCYGDRIEGIVLAGNLPDTFIRTLSERYFIPVALISNTYQIGDKRKVVPVQFRRKLHVFIVEASSFVQLDSLLQKNIEYSMWWNHMASFFILDLSPNCVNKHNYLYLAWQRNILNAKVICFHKKIGIVVFNYNPYTSQAPSSWQHDRVFPGINRHTFTVFSRRYGGNKSICVDLDFEKTKNLGKYPIHVAGFNHHKLRPRRANRGLHEYLDKINRIQDAFCDVLHATIKFHRHPDAMTRENADIEGKTCGLLNTWSYYLATYPHQSTGVVIISQFRGHKSQLNKILSVIDINSRFAVGIVYLITLIFFKFFVRQAFMTAILNLIRITCSKCFTNLPGNTASRMYLGCLFFFAVTIHGIYKGKWASLLTTVIPLRNIDTFQDIVDFGNKVFICDHSEFLFDYSVLQKNIIEIDAQVSCAKKVRDEPSIVGITFAEGSVLDFSRKYNLHISPEFIVSAHTSFCIRWYWPLEERINIIIQRMVEADIIDSWDTKCNPIQLIDFEFDEAVRNNRNFKNIELGELAFAFAILFIGLSCATVAFIIELAMQYECMCRCRCKVFLRPRLGRQTNANAISVIPLNSHNRIP